MIHMNTPFDYRGYRFLQASYNMPATARAINLRVTPVTGGESQEITIKRDGEARAGRWHEAAFQRIPSELFR